MKFLRDFEGGGEFCEAKFHIGGTTTPPYVVIWSFGHGFQKTSCIKGLRGVFFDHVFLKKMVMVKK